MARSAEAFNELFQVPGADGLPPDVLTELESTARMHSISPQEVFYKWESYALKMGAADTRLDLNTVRAFKKDIQEGLERETRERRGGGGPERKDRVMATPRAAAAGGDDFMGMLEGITPKTPATNGAAKRKAALETPAPTKAARSGGRSSPTEGRTPAQTNGIAAVPFNERQNAGQIMETLNAHLDTFEPPIAPPATSRVALKANTDLKKFSYKPLAMHQSEASEVLDERIDEFTQIIQQEHGLDASAFGNAASMSTNEIVAVGRICSDTAEGRLNEASIVLEMSRRQGAGLRVPLRMPAGASYEFFPGQIVAVRGNNAEGDKFVVREILDMPLLPPAASTPAALQASNARQGLEEEDSSAATAAHALNLIVAAGPYTTDDNLDFEALHALCDRATESAADAVVLVGPFLDVEHPLVATGDFELPAAATPNGPDSATLQDAFRHFVGEPLRRLAQAHPGVLVVLVPSARDSVLRHVAWPQEAFGALRKELGLPRQVRSVTNPCTISLNDVVLALSAQDVLNDLRRDEALVGRPSEPNLLARLPRHLVRQRHFYPLYPPPDRSGLPKPGAAADDEFAIGMPLDPSYLKLGEWLNVRPDVLVTPSVLPPFAKVVESVVAVNPGSLSKRRGAGTYAQLTVHARRLTTEEKADADHLVGHNVFERARVDVVRI